MRVGTGEEGRVGRFRRRFEGGQELGGEGENADWMSEGAEEVKAPVAKVGKKR